MGILIKDNIEIDGIGNASEIYGRLESIRINKISGCIEGVILYYTSKSISDEIGRKYYEDTSSVWSGGPINHTIVSGSEITLPSFYEYQVTSSAQIEYPIYSTVTQSVSFIDFDLTGSQFTNYRIESQSIQTGTGIRYGIDLSILNNDIYGYTYNLIKKDIKDNILPNSIVEDL